MTRVAAAVAALCTVTTLSVACSTTPTPAVPAPVTATASATPTAPATPTASARAAGAGTAFTVSGDNPVTPNGSQDTYADVPGASCDSAQLKADQSVGASVAGGFSLEGFPAASDLLAHFLAGTGTGVDYRLGSTISEQAQASAGFQTVNHLVQTEIAARLRAGNTRVLLSAAQLPTVLFASTTTDLYWAFRGTQGLTVSGSGRRENGRYGGALTYVIRDSYGFPADDALAGFGPPMRYLQTACGAPQHQGGARWFPDTITVRVPFTANA
ncbi:MAG TPA: hypothetical protein VH021_14260 [Trebonia sp.]|nr:hypothetical protein [Trebonia sp.]